MGILDAIANALSNNMGHALEQEINSLKNQILNTTNPAAADILRDMLREKENILKNIKR